ncbi:MAG: hypothetical protein JW891_13265 [Candidatus Lokiarchaeota archaeon]|nr:hypothetical protein [Candidatus Lokiarchaeota archaeon]
MRFLSFHCEYFRYEVKKKSRSKIFEQVNENNKTGSLENTIVLFISIEKKDEDNYDYLSQAIFEIEAIAKQLKVSNIALIPFAHLFGELSDQEFGLNALKALQENLETLGYTTIRPSYGWFNEIELKAKGHPLSRISRRI